MSQHVVPLRTYYMVFAALMVLLVLTVAAAQIENDVINILSAITIAVVKAVLILLYFMHLKYSGNTVRVVIAAAFIWLGILFVFALCDYGTRGWAMTASMTSG